MSDKERKLLNTLRDVACGHYSPEEGTELILSDFAAECRAPAPQPANYALALDVVDAIEWIDQNEPKRARDVLAEVRDKLRAATPQVAPELELEKESDGRWLAEFTRFPGALAYGPSREEAIRNAAKVLIETEQASPTTCKSPYHKPTSMFCLDCIPPDAPISVLLLSNRRPTEEETKRGLEIAKLMEQASPTPEESAKLCYVESGVAYFTTQELDKQWGDDWNDAPYEHNAGTPYGPYRPGDNWTITEIRFAGDFQVPCDGHCNSPWSVQQINKGFCPWLRTHQNCIMAGATVEEFCNFVTANDGCAAAPKSRSTGVSLDGGKTIHSKFKND